MIKNSSNEVKECAKCKQDIYSFEKRDNRNNGKVVHLKGQCVAKQANTVQKKWMSDVADWASNTGLRMLYGNEWEFGKWQIHHALGRSAKNNKVPIGHEFILPVHFDLHDVSSNHELNVTHCKKAFVKEFGTQRELFSTMYHSMQEEGYTVPSKEVFNAIMSTSA
jgi:hypothetical protein